jgi:hypothetical protein
MAGEVFFFALSLRVASMCLLLYLMHMYWKSYRHIKSEFTAGLLFFAFILFLQNISEVFFRLVIGVDYSVLDQVSLYDSIPSLFQAAGLIALVYITRK